MPTLTVAGHSVTVGDEFLKLSPEEQNAAVEHIASNLPAEKPSGVVAGLAHGVAEHLRGTSETLKQFGGIDTGDGSTAAKFEPKDYKGAHIIREGGHWYNPSDYQPSQIPQAIAEQAPGLAQDLAVGMTVGKVNKWAGLGAGVGSTLLRTLGPMAQENAKARTGTDNAEVTTEDKVRAGLTGAAQAPLNAVGLGRFIPGIGGKVAGVGMEGAGNALKKYLTTVGAEAATGGARDAVGQVGTTIGTDKGVQYDPNKTAEAVVTGGAGAGLLAAPKLTGNVATASKFREFGGANSEAATALANRQMQAADGKNLVGTFGGTKTAAEAVRSAHADVHTELAAASKGETLSTENANTLARIKEGGGANARELDALASEASPDVVSLARQALLSKKLKSMGTLGTDSFTGGLSGQMERLRPISNPVGTGVAMGATALAGHAGGLGMLGTFAPQVIAAILGGYGGARMIDKLTGARSPAQGFTDKFADGSPIRTPVAPEAPDPYNPSAGPWGARVSDGLSGPSVAAPSLTPAPNEPTLRQTLNSNVKIDEGIGKIVKKIGDEKKKSLIADAIPALQRLAATRQAPAEPEAPYAPNPTALSMLKQKLKQGLPEVAPVPEAPAPAPPQLNPVAMKMLQVRLKAGLPPEAAPAPAPAPIPEPAPEAPSFNPTALKMLQAKLKTGLPPEPAPIEPAPAPVPQAPSFNPTAISMLKRKLKIGLPEPVQTQTDAAANVASGPASPGISALMQKLQVPSAQPAAPATAPAAAPKVSPTPLMAKITKKANGKVKEEPHPEEDQPYAAISEEGLWRKMLSDQAVADKELSSYSPIVREKYSKNVIENRDNKRGIAETIALEHEPADAKLASDLYHQLDHISRRAQARKAISHYSNLMSPAARAAVNKHFTEKAMTKMWKSE